MYVALQWRGIGFQKLETYICLYNLYKLYRVKPDNKLLYNLKAHVVVALLLGKLSGLLGSEVSGTGY